MCFSEKVSFATSGVLTLCAFVCFWEARYKKELYALAAMPLFFALQQAAEGVEWLFFKGIEKSPEMAESAKNLFLFIAFVVWPFWISFSLWMAEKVPFRRRLLEMGLFLGIGISIYNGWKILFLPTYSNVIEQGIYYKIGIHPVPGILYIILVTIPWFISSLPLMWLIRILGIAATSVAIAFYLLHFTSVWCFFAALISSILIFVLRAASNTGIKPP